MNTQPTPYQLGAFAASVELGAFAIDSDEPILLQAAADGDDGSLPKFTMRAYSGGLMRLKGLPHPVVVDLKGDHIIDRSPLPVYRDHDRKQRVGHGTPSITAQGIAVEGVFSGTGPAAQETLAESRSGFPFQSSIGAKALRAEFFKRGQSVYVNGRTFNGPIIVARKIRLKEVSWVSEGADTDTTAAIAASMEGNEMTFEQWLDKNGIEASAISDDFKKSLKQTYRIEIGELKATAVGSGGSDDGGVTPTEIEREKVAAMKELRAEYADEQERIAGVRGLCGDLNADICAEAIREGWSVDKCELKLLRSSRPTLEGHTRTASSPGPVNTMVLEAAALCSLGYDDDITAKAYGDQTMTQAQRFKGIGLKDLCIMAARNDGADVPAVFGNGDAVIEAATSTRSLASVASNVVSKIALRVYEAAEIVALDLCKHRNVSDFKEVENWRLVGTGRWEKVGTDGKLKSGKADDQRYTSQADTYGQTMGISRKDIINDDMSILDDLGTLMGQEGASLIDHLFFTLLLSNPASFFHADNSNLLSGPGSAFGISGLQQSRQIFRKMKAGPGGKAKDQRPINAMAKFLLVPPELETEAENILAASGVNLAGDTDRELPSRNPFKDKYKLRVAPHLSDASYTGNSAASWYQLADPAKLPAFMLAFLHGVKSPTIRRVAPPPDELGVFYQGYFDVGVSVADPKGAVKAVGS